MIVRNYPTVLMFFVEELFKEDTSSNIFKQLSLYDFWNTKEGICNITPKDFARTDSYEVCIEVIKPDAIIKMHELVFNLKAQNFASLRDNLKRRLSIDSFARWYA